MDFVVVENYKKGKLVGIGSGFIYDIKGYIMTNHHVIDEANEIIAKLEDNSAVGEIKRALRENVWDHAILECGMMDILLSKGIMMFLTLETKDIKDQTALISQEVELDRLDIQRQKELIYTLSEQAKNLVKALEAKVAI